MCNCVLCRGDHPPIARRSGTELITQLIEERNNLCHSIDRLEGELAELRAACRQFLRDTIDGKAHVYEDYDEDDETPCDRIERLVGGIGA